MYKAAIIYIHGTYAGTDTGDRETKLGAKGLGGGTRDYPNTKVGKVRGMWGFEYLDGKGEPEETAIKRLCGAPDANVFCFLWTGGDTASERKNAASLLYPDLNVMRSQFRALNVVTHSHGGNVLGHALSIDPSLKIDAAYLLACPIMEGEGRSWRKGENMERVRTLHTFSHPYDKVQVLLASARNSFDTGTKLGYGVSSTLPGIKDISIDPGGLLQVLPHSAMHTAEGFNMAAKKLGK